MLTLNTFTQVTKRIVGSGDPSVRRNVVQKNGVGLSALEFAALNDKVGSGQEHDEPVYPSLL